MPTYRLNIVRNKKQKSNFNAKDLTLFGLIIELMKLIVTNSGTQDENNPDIYGGLTYHLKLEGKWT
jgi:hypothetical protein